MVVIAVFHEILNMGVEMVLLLTLVRWLIKEDQLFIKTFTEPGPHKAVDDEVDGAVEDKHEVVDVGHSVQPPGVVWAELE